ncbi:MAG: cache domain-containing protein, partial [Syntrophobacteraceae bacterium]
MIVVLPIVIIGLFAIMKASNALTDISKEQVANVAVKLADMTQVALSKELKLLKELSIEQTIVETAARVGTHKPEDSATDFEKVSKHLSAVMKQIGSEYEEIIVVSPEGVVLADGSDGKSKGINVTDRDYFKAAKDGRVTIGTVIKSRKTGNPVVPMGAPILGESGEFVGSLAIIANIDFLLEKVAGAKTGKTGYAFMVDGDGRFIAHPRRELVFEGNVKNFKGMEAVVSGML